MGSLIFQFRIFSRSVISQAQYCAPIKSSSHYRILALILLTPTVLEIADKKPQIRGKLLCTPVNDGRYV